MFAAKTAENAPDPLEQTSSSGANLQFRSEVLKREYTQYSKGFKQKTNWIRFLPPITGGFTKWMMAVGVYSQPEGQTLTEFVDPRTFDRGAPSAFAEAHDWFRRNSKEDLYNREKNVKGFKLTPKKIGVAWYIDPAAEAGENLKLLSTSLYDGAWGGTTGLAYKIWMESNIVETEPGSKLEGKCLYGDISDPDSGRLILVEKNKPEGGETKFASYNVRIGKQVDPIQGHLDKLSPEELAAIVPLESIFKRLSYEEQQGILLEYIGRKFYDQIFELGVSNEPTEQP